MPGDFARMTPGERLAARALAEYVWDQAEAARRERANGR